MQRPTHLRVTSIISPFTGVEFVPQEILAPAGKRGSDVHKIIEDRLNGFVYEVPEPYQGYLTSFDKFYESHYPMFQGSIEIEKRLYCEKLMITGQMDVIARGAGQTVILDWKTSNRVQPSWALQAAAYKYLALENGYKDTERLLMVKLSKDGRKPQIKEYDTYYDDLDIFMKCLDIYEHFEMWNRNGGRDV